MVRTISHGVGPTVDKTSEMTIPSGKGALLVGQTTGAPVEFVVGTDGKYLKAASGEASGLLWDTPTGADTNIAASGKSTQTADFTTTSTSWTDITNPATLTLSGLSSGSTYTVIAMMHLEIDNSSAGETGRYRLNIGGTAQDPVQVQATTSGEALSIVGLKSGITGVTTVDIKGQCVSSVGSNTITVQFTAGPLSVASIVAIALLE